MKGLRRGRDQIRTPKALLASSGTAPQWWDLCDRACICENPMTACWSLCALDGTGGTVGFKNRNVRAVAQVELIWSQSQQSCVQAAPSGARQ